MQFQFNMTKSLFVAAVFTGILCGLWGGFGDKTGLSVWAGFAGCTAYFASGKSRLPGVMLTIATNLLGVAFGMGMVWLGNGLSGILPNEIATTIGVGVLVAGIVCCAATNWFSFVPGIFVGCYSLFAIQLDWKTLVLSLIAGVILGVACDVGGAWAGKILGVQNKR